MGGITLEEFTQSVAYREIYGQGRQEGRAEGRQEGWQEGLQEGRQEGLQEGRQEGLQEGRQEGEIEMALRLLRRRCGDLSAQQIARIRALPLGKLEALGEALLDFQGVDDLNAWLGAGG